ncbi:hypothetical protein [Streptomyces sp. NPDC058045]|uniref:hypothetical protein n=1 Tax=Streptomyces sp. NPDC058045 TaxID=3346311 RepID=UPI0036E9F046
MQSPCLGVCERAPAALVSESGPHGREQILAPTSAASVRWAARWGPDPSPDPTVCETPVTTSVPQCGEPGLRLLRRIGAAGSRSLDGYRATGGYTALSRALHLGPAATRHQLGPWARMLGMARGAGHRYLVCGDGAGTPGAFRDRILLEGDPYAVVEAVTLAGFASGCGRGLLRLRPGVPRARRRMEQALAEARGQGLLGTGVLGRPGFDFDMEIRQDAQAADSGQDAQAYGTAPVAVLDLEALLGMGQALLDGAVGRGDAQLPAVTRLFGVCGEVGCPGLYEAAPELSVRELILRAGAVPSRRGPRAVLLTGNSAVLLRPADLDAPLTAHLTAHPTGAARPTSGQGLGPATAEGHPPLPGPSTVLVLDDAGDPADLGLDPAPETTERSTPTESAPQLHHVNSAAQQAS